MKTEADLAPAAGSGQELSEALSSIRTETVKLSGLMTNLLELGSSSGSRAVLERVEAAELVESATRLVTPLAAEQNVDIRLVADDGQLRVSRVAVEHAIQNLAENAIRRAPDNSTVCVECKREPDGWKMGDLLAVDRVFEPYGGRTRPRTGDCQAHRRGGRWQGGGGVPGIWINTLRPDHSGTRITSDSRLRWLDLNGGRNRLGPAGSRPQNRRPVRHGRTPPRSAAVRD